MWRPSLYCQISPSPSYYLHGWGCNVPENDLSYWRKSGDRYDNRNYRLDLIGRRVTMGMGGDYYTRPLNKGRRDRMARGYFNYYAGTPRRIIRSLEDSGGDIRFDEKTFLPLLTARAQEMYRRRVPDAKEIETAVQVAYASVSGFQCFPGYTPDVVVQRRKNAYYYAKYVRPDIEKREVWLELFKNPKNRIRAWRK